MAVVFLLSGFDHLSCTVLPSVLLQWDALASARNPAAMQHRTLHQLRQLRSIAELLTAFALSPVEITRDKEHLGTIAGFPSQPMEDADVYLPTAKPPV